MGTPLEAHWDPTWWQLPESLFYVEEEARGPYLRWSWNAHGFFLPVWLTLSRATKVKACANHIVLRSLWTPTTSFLTHWNLRTTDGIRLVSHHMYHLVYFPRRNRLVNRIRMRLHWRALGYSEDMSSNSQTSCGRHATGHWATGRASSVWTNSTWGCPSRSECVVPERLPLPQKGDEILSGIDEDVSSIRDGYSTVGIFDPASTVERHLVSKVYIHSPVARTFFCTWRVHSHMCTSSCVCAYTHGSSHVKKRCLLHVCHVAPSRLIPSHVSPVIAVPARSLRHHVPVHHLDEFSRPKSAGDAQLRTCTEKFGHLAKSDANQHMLWAQACRQDHFCGQWHNAHWRSRPQHLWPLENYRREQRTIRCSYKVWNLCFARFSWCFCSSSIRQACIGKPIAWQREREERESFVTSVAESM